MNTLIPWLIPSASFCLLLAAVWKRRLRRSALALSDLPQSLRACRLLVALVSHLQQHRGMSTTWLSGDAAFKQRMQAKQAQIAELMPEIIAVARREGAQHCPCLTGNDLALFNFHWKGLLDELPGLTPEQNIAQHSQMISRLLDWLVAIGEARIESLRSDGRFAGAARNFAQRLPLLTECLGQARAIGSSVAARRACTPVARVRLMFLIGRAEALLEQAVAADDRGPATRQAQQAIQRMAVTVRTRMLLSSGVLVSSSDYFLLATQAIDRVFEWIEACAEDLLSSAAAPATNELTTC